MPTGRVIALGRLMLAVMFWNVRRSFRDIEASAGEQREPVTFEGENGRSARLVERNQEREGAIAACERTHHRREWQRHRARLDRRAWRKDRFRRSGRTDISRRPDYRCQRDDCDAGIH